MTDNPLDPGLPRPRSTYRAPGGDQQLPVAFINGSYPMSGDWLTFRDDLPGDVLINSCAVCGNPFSGPRFYLRWADAYVREEHELWTSGPATDAACAVIAIKFCPHLLKQLAQDPEAPIAYRWDGPGPGFHDPGASPADLLECGFRVDDSCTPLTADDLIRASRTPARRTAA